MCLPPSSSGGLGDHLPKERGGAFIASNPIKKKSGARNFCNSKHGKATLGPSKKPEKNGGAGWKEKYYSEITIKLKRGRKLQ